MPAPKSNRPTAEPLPFSGRWLWHNHDDPLADTADRPDHLPADVFARLDGFLPRPNPRVTQLVKAYPTREAAVAALVRATETRVARG